MIPKKIHYCWFGKKPLPDLAKKCLLSWEKHCPDYEIIRWDEDSFDLQQHQYTAEAYKAGKYAFITDYVRLWALFIHGGIYMDTDVEVLKSLDGFLHHRAFSGFENEHSVQTGIMGSEINGEWVKQELACYDNKHFILPDGTPDLTPNTKTITEHLTEDGFLLNNCYQEHKNIVVMYPHDYFCPKSWKTGKIELTENSYTIHHFDGSWLPKHHRAAIYLYRLFTKIVGEKVSTRLVNLIRTGKQ